MPLTIKLSALEAVAAFDAVPNNEPVKPIVEVTDPVTMAFPFTSKAALDELLAIPILLLTYKLPAPYGDACGVYPISNDLSANA